jgi:hypothetical protein
MLHLVDPLVMEKKLFPDDDQVSLFGRRAILTRINAGQGQRDVACCPFATFISRD